MLRDFLLQRVVVVVRSFSPSRIRVWVFTALVALMSSMPAFAVSITLDQALEQAVAENRDFAVARFEIVKAQGRALQAGLPKNPEIELGGRSGFAFNNSGDRNVSIGFSQAFARRGRLGLARKAAALTVDEQSLFYQDAKRQLVGEVQVLYLRVLTLDRQVAARQKLIDTGGKLAAVIERRYKAGEVPETDLAPIEIENAKLVQDQQLVAIQRSTAELALKQSLGLDPGDSLVLTSDLDSLVARMNARDQSSPPLEMRKDYQAAEVVVAQAEADLRVAKVEAYGDITAGLDYENEHSFFVAPVGVKQDNFFGVKISIPFPARNRNQGRILELQAARDQAEAQLRAAGLRIEAEVAQARAALGQLEPVLRQYQDELIPLAEKQFQAVQRAYQQGQGGIFPVFQARQQRLSLELDYLGYQTTRIESLANLETVLGTNPHLSAK